MDVNNLGLVLVIGATAILTLSGCTARPISIPPVPENQKPYFQVPVSQTDQPGPIAPDKLKFFADQGLTRVFQLSILGSKQFRKGYINANAKIQDPQTLDWLDWDTPNKQAISLTEETGTAFIFCTLIPADPPVLLRYQIEVRLPSGGRCTMEVADGGACFKLDEQLPKKNEVVTLAIYFVEPHERFELAKNSQWQLFYKEEVTDQTGRKALADKISRVNRGVNDQLWLRVKPGKLEVFSCSNIREVARREKPDLVLENISSLTIKRVDQLTKQGGLVASGVRD